MSLRYAISLSCDHDGCRITEFFYDTSEALKSNWAMVPSGWLCPEHSYQWKIANEPTHEPTDEELLG